MLEQRSAELVALLERFTGRDGIHPTSIGPLCLYRSSTPSEPVPNLYEPSVCIIAQGSKRVLLADECYHYDTADYLLVTVDLPICGQILEATPQKPYLSLSITLDPGQVNSLLMEPGLPAREESVPSRTPARGIAVNRIDVPLLESVLRLVRLLETPQDIRMLAPLAVREIQYRLLMGEQGARLRHIASENSQAQRIARAIHWIKQNYTKSFRIEEVAQEVYMSPSGLHHHFKAVTAMSPLQYQKQLRLQEARQLMLGKALDAATASYEVGYESPSQFSREYRRLFGAPPQRDIARLRSATAQGGAFVG